MKKTNMKKPKISVIMAVYNSEKFLGETIQSILNQTFKDFELMVINDNSTDESLKLIKKFQKIDKRIKLINGKVNIGPAGARNKGLKIAMGKYIAILDSDDISHTKRLETQYNYLEKNPHIFLVGSSAIYIDENGKEIRRFRKYNDYKMLAWRLPKSCSIIHSCVMFRNTGKFWYNEKFKYAHDYNLFLDILGKGKNLTNLPQFLIKYRVHPDSISVAKKREQEGFTDAIKERHKNLRNKVNIFSKTKYLLKSVLFYLKTFREKRVKSIRTQYP